MARTDGRKKVTDSERIIVGVNRDGKVWYVWHKVLGKSSNPIKCSYDNLAETIRNLAIKAEKLDV